MRTVTVLRAFQRQGYSYNRWGSRLRPSIVSPVGSSFRDANPNMSVRQPGSAMFQLLGWTSCSAKGNGRRYFEKALLFVQSASQPLLVSANVKNMWVFCSGYLRVGPRRMVEELKYGEARAQGSMQLQLR